MADYPDHEHEHEHEHAAEDEVITLLDEEGKEHQFALLDVIEVDENEYAILIPAGEGSESEEEADEAVILRMEEDTEGNEVLVDIEDEAEFERVATAWEELLDEEDAADEEEDED